MALRDEPFRHASLGEDRRLRSASALGAGLEHFGFPVRAKCCIGHSSAASARSNGADVYRLIDGRKLCRNQAVRRCRVTLRVRKRHSCINRKNVFPFGKLRVHLLHVDFHVGRNGGRFLFFQGQDSCLRGFDLGLHFFLLAEQPWPRVIIVHQGHARRVLFRRACVHIFPNGYVAVNLRLQLGKPVLQLSPLVFQSRQFCGVFALLDGAFLFC